MDPYRKLVETLRQALITGSPLPLFTAKVKSVETETCTVLVGDLELDEVRLKATISGADNKVLIKPKPGSYVLVGSLTGDLKDLAVIRVDEMESLEYVQDGLKVKIDSGSGKIEVSNNAASLKDIFKQLSDLLQQFKVSTPAGPSTVVLPDTLAAINQFEMSFNQLLN